MLYTQRNSAASVGYSAVTDIACGKLDSFEGVTANKGLSKRYGGS